ncbi:MAG: hypothetical protein ACUZ8I_12525 [Candidatus Scalindua sp.]
MNEAQAKIAWWVVILLSLASLVYGVFLLGEDRASFEAMLLTFFIIPVFLLGGLAFIRAKDKET